MARVPTVAIEHPGNPGRRIYINESDYNPRQHRLWQEPQEEVAPAARPKPSQPQTTADAPPPTPAAGTVPAEGLPVWDPDVDPLEVEEILALPVKPIRSKLTEITDTRLLEVLKASEMLAATPRKTVVALIEARLATLE